jgi:subtilase family serine protease
MQMNRIPRRRPRRARRWPWLAAAPLTACLAAAGATAASGGTAATAASPPPALNCGAGLGGPVSCSSPREYQLAYGVTPLLRRGIDGSGETVVVGPEPAATSSGAATDIHTDLAYFDHKFRLPQARLHIVNTAKSATPYLAGPEEVTDTELVHAFAPDASLDVIVTPPDTAASPATFAAAITRTIQEGTARQAAVISISASVGEHYLTHAEVTRMHAALEHARDQHVTVVTSSGDSGAIASFYGPPVQVSMPTSDPLVLGVGGTILDATPAGRYLGEMAWNDNTEASGGGYSALFPRPPYQDGLARGASRGVPDVAANADGSTAMALALVAHGHSELRASGGTSSSTPLWAGVIALADQQAGRHLGFVNPALYAIARGPAYHRAFHDVVTGDNSILWPTGVFTGYNAGPGWDPVTGLGSPDAQYLVPLIARAAAR